MGRIWAILLILLRGKLTDLISIRFLAVVPSLGPLGEVLDCLLLDQHDPELELLVLVLVK